MNYSLCLLENPGVLREQQGSAPSVKRFPVFIALALGVVAMACSSETPPTVSPDADVGAEAKVQGSDPPNVLLVIADDFGIDASPCHTLGADKPKMPTVSALCASGVVFDNVWAAPECSPTRATLISGQFGFRTRVGAAGDRLELATPSLQQLLETAEPSYANAVIGKWHLAGSNASDTAHPAEFGVEHYEGLMAGALPDYFAWRKVAPDGSQAEVTAYATSVFADDASQWLSTASSPWFLWLAFTAPHTPFHLPPATLHSGAELSGTAEDIMGNPLPYYHAAAEALDRELGRVLDSLPAVTRANTVVIFVGDNGTPAQAAQAPFSRTTVKGSLFDGGVHVPLVVSGAGVTRAGTHEPALLQSVDIFATVLDLAGVAPSAQTDGTSFKPLLADAQQGGRASLYAEFFRGGTRNPNDDVSAYGWTVRNERYQLVHSDQGSSQLFDLETDPGTTTDLLTTLPVADATTTIADELESIGLTLRGQ